MRISVHTTDPGYAEWTRIMTSESESRISVFCDGVEVRSPETADDEEGYVLANKLDEAGLPYIEPGADEWATEELRGTVRIVVEPVTQVSN